MKFIAFSSGDRTTGCYGHEATIDIPYLFESPETIKAAKESLEDAFGTIFDDKNTKVLTQEEFDKWTAAEEDE